MAGINYNRLATTATRLIKRFGVTTHFTTTTATSFNVSAQEFGTVTTTTYTALAVQAEIRYTQAQHTDTARTSDQSPTKRVVFYVSAATPVHIDDVFTFGGNRLTVVSVEPVQPAGVVVFYVVEAV